MGDMINLTISSNVQEFQSIRRFPTDITITQLKNKLELLTGVVADNMQLELRNNEDEFVGTLADEGATLSAASVKEGYRIRVQDVSLSSISLASPDSVANGVSSPEETPKFVLSDEAYAQRTNSVLAWKQREKLGRFNPDTKKLQEEKEAKFLEVAERVAKTLQVGQRCEVRTPRQMSRRGCVAFVGETKFKRGYWVGVKFDEPVGKNDGTVSGVKYFECAPKYGGFVRPQDVAVGDFPEVSIDDMDEI